MNIDGDLLNKDGTRATKTGKRLIGLKEKLGWRKLPPNVPCAGCTKDNAVKRICPNPGCAKELPDDIDSLSDLHIAVIGTKGAGKSHYIALLIHRLRMLEDTKVFSWQLSMGLDDQTERRYNDNFYNPLFKGHRLLDSTREVKVQEDVSHPLLYQLNFTKRSIILAFFDTAGEDLNKDVDNMPPIVKKYIANASAIICLLDPFRFPLVCAEKGKPPPDQGDKTPGAILSGVSKCINRNLRSQGKTPPPNSKWPISLAVTFSKIDAIRCRDDKNPVLLYQGHNIFQPSRHRGIFHHGDFTSIQQLMEGWIRQVDDRKTFLSVTKSFKKVAFFGVSALGDSLEEGKGLQGDKLSAAPDPWRVEDPFLWILYQNGLIKMGGIEGLGANLWNTLKRWGASLYAPIAKAGKALYAGMCTLAAKVTVRQWVGTAVVLCVVAGIWGTIRLFHTATSKPKAIVTNRPVAVSLDDNKDIEYERLRLSETSSNIGEAHFITGQAHFKSGEAHFNKSDYDAAIKDYGVAIEEYQKVIAHDAKRATEIHPWLASAFNSRGSTYTWKGNYDLAIKDFDSAIKDCEKIFALDSKRAAVFYSNRGSAYDWASNYGLAIQDYEKAIALDPNRTAEFNLRLAAVYYRRGNTEFNKGDYHVALRDYGMAISLDPQNAVSYNNRGNAYVKVNNYDAAIDDYKKAIALDPTHFYKINLAVAYRGRGDEYYAKGDYGAAKKDYEEAVKQDPKLDPVLQNHIKQLSVLLGRSQPTPVQPSTAGNQTNPDVYFNKGQNLLSENCYDAAIKEFDTAIKGYMDSPNLDSKRIADLARAYDSRGTAYTRKGYYNVAVHDYGEAIKAYEKTEPKPVVELASVYNRRGGAHDKKSDYDSAINDYSEVIKIYERARLSSPKVIKDLALAYRTRGYTYFKKGESIFKKGRPKEENEAVFKIFDAALKDYQSALKLDPSQKADLEVLIKQASAPIINSRWLLR